MYSLEKLKKLGLEWRQRFSEIEFVGEIEVDEADVRRLCPSLGKCLEDNTHDENFCSAMTVAVVNLAHYYQPNAFDGFRDQALAEFGHPNEDTAFWQREIGEPVLRILVKYFGETDTARSWRFVAPIMRQAGVPGTQIGRLTQFLLYITDQFGWHFSEIQYQQAVQAFQIPSNALRYFLKSQAGWRYCLDLVRLLRHHRNGLFTREAEPNLYGFRGNILRYLLQLDGGAAPPVRSDHVPKPRLILDLDQLVFAIDFPPRGLNGHYRREGGRQITVSRYYLKASDFERGVAGWTRQPDGHNEYWSIKPWRPAESPWAIFRPSDGVFLQSPGALPPGDYILVLPEESVDALSAGRINVDYGTLSLPVDDDGQFRILDCTLPPGFQIPEIGLCVEQASRRFPELRFTQSAQTLRHTPQVFIGRLPEIEIVNWSEDFARKYLVIVECAGQSRLIDCSRSGRIRLDVPNPSQGAIRIEARGRTPRGLISVI